MSGKLVLDSFLGIDASKSEYEIHKTRAADMINLISDAGVNHKRKGFHEVAKFDGEIHGIYNLGNSDDLIVHAGLLLYKLTIDILKPLGYKVQLLPIPTGVAVISRASWGLYDRDTLYLFVGDYLYYKDGKLTRAVNDTDNTYIPTTTLSIDAESEAEKTRIDFEQPNLLTKWRINSLSGKPQKGDGSALDRTYYLDDDISRTDIVTVLYTQQDGIDIEYKTTCKDSAISEKVLYAGASKVGTIYCDNGKVVFDSVKESYRGEDSIKVMFAVDSASDSERVTNCTFGMLFGLRGNNDRLFISGNTSHPNMDFYSDSNKYTYFPTENYTLLGSNSSSITGYSRINDGSLAVHKSVGDSSGIYYRTSSMETYRDNATGADTSKTVFPITAGAVGEFCASSRTCHRLGDDPLFLSNNGVCSIALGSNATTNERYAKERSENIRPLLPYNRSQAMAEVIDGRYYLFNGDKCYIADSRYKYSDKHLADDTFNYEWWIWQMPSTVTSLCNKHKFLYIGTADGRIWKQSLDYIDKSYELIADGNCTVIKTDNLLRVNCEIVKTWNSIERVICVDDREYEAHLLITNDKSADRVVKLYDGGIEVTLDNEQHKLKARVVNTIVTAKYSTGAISFGTNSNYKTIKKVAVTTDAVSMSKYSLKLESLNSSLDIDVEQLGYFDFGNIDFANFTFGEKTFSNSIIKRVRMRNINYMQIHLLSTTNRDCVLNNITIDYDRTGIIKGGVN